MLLVNIYLHLPTNINLANIQLRLPVCTHQTNLMCRVCTQATMRTQKLASTLVGSLLDRCIHPLSMILSRRQDRQCCLEPNLNRSRCRADRRHRQRQEGRRESPLRDQELGCRGRQGSSFIRMLKMICRLRMRMGLLSFPLNIQSDAVNQVLRTYQLRRQAPLLVHTPYNLVVLQLIFFLSFPGIKSCVCALSRLSFSLWLL